MRKNTSFLSIFSIALVSMILITSQSPAAFAGIGDDHDADGDNYSPNEGDCDDTDPNRYPGHGCEVSITEDVEEIKDEINDLIDSGEFEINKGQTNGLFTKLNNAVEKTDDDKLKVAINMLESFINQINAYITSGSISQDNGDGLISEVQEIIKYLESF